MKRRISRREFAALAASGAAATLATGFRRKPEGSRSARRRSKKPNIIVVFLDDLHSSVLDRMPEIRENLARKGTTYRGMVNSIPLCGPSRCSVFRGQYAGNLGVYTNEDSWKVYRDRDYARDDLAVWMREAGYRTSFFGKYINNYDGRTENYGGWGRWHAYNSGGMGWESINDQGRVRGVKPQDADTRTAQAALAWLRTSTGNKTPFFSWVSFTAPHSKYFHDPADDDEFRRVRAPRSPEFNERDVSDKPRHIKKLPRLSRDTVQRIDELYRDSMRSCLRADDFVGKLIETLKRTKQLDETYIFLYSDNGNHFGEHRLEPGKNAPYRTDIGNPLIVRGPDVGKGRVSRKTVESIDLAPTLVELAGGRVPNFVDGRSIFTGKERPYGYSEHPKGGGGIPAWWAAKDPRSNTLYVEYENGEVEYYQNDRFEIRNRPEDAPEGIVAFLRSRRKT